MPDLEQRRAALHRVQPADIAPERVVDRHQPAAALGGVASQESADVLKSIHPVSPSTPAWPREVVTSCPGTSVIP